MSTKMVKISKPLLSESEFKIISIASKRIVINITCWCVFCASGNSIIGFVIFEIFKYKHCKIFSCKYHISYICVTEDFWLLSVASNSKIIIIFQKKMSINQLSFELWCNCFMRLILNLFKNKYDQKPTKSVRVSCRETLISDIKRKFWKKINTQPIRMTRVELKNKLWVLLIRWNLVNL